MTRSTTRRSTARLTLEQLEGREVLTASPFTAGSLPQHLIDVASVQYFTAIDGSHGSELWASDGTTAGTRMVADVRPGSAGSAIADLATIHGKLVFVANDGTHGAELFASDGTTAGTSLLRDINPGRAG